VEDCLAIRGPRFDLASYDDNVKAYVNAHSLPVVIATQQNHHHGELLVIKALGLAWQLGIKNKKRPKPPACGSIKALETQIDIYKVRLTKQATEITRLRADVEDMKKNLQGVSEHNLTVRVDSTTYLRCFSANVRWTQ
jgi:hypothetical protein